MSYETQHYLTLGEDFMSYKICDEKSLSLAGIWTRDSHGLPCIKQMTYQCATVLQ